MKANPRFLYLVLVVFVLLQVWAYASAAENEQVVRITAKKFEYTPKEITLKKGIPAVLEFTTADRLHGFYCPALKIRTDIEPGRINTLRFVPNQVGIFPFHCDNFCGGGHDKMRGTITVLE